MSLFFFYEVFFLKAVEMYIVTLIAQVIKHSFDRSCAATEFYRSILHRPKAIFFYQFQNIFQPFFIGAVVHLYSGLG